MSWNGLSLKCFDNILVCYALIGGENNIKEPFWSKLNMAANKTLNLKLLWCFNNGNFFPQYFLVLLFLWLLESWEQCPFLKIFFVFVISFNKFVHWLFCLGKNDIKKKNNLICNIWIDNNSQTEN